MSNPAVIKLQRTKIKHSIVWLDDNFGEAIHIHLDDHRVDLTVKEFEQLYNDLCEILNDIFPIEGLNFSNIDPVFLSTWLWPLLPTITHVKYDKVYLEELWGPHEKTGSVRLKDSVGVKALKGLSTDNEGFRKSHHIGQSDNQRLKESLDSIKEHGYPYDNKYIILGGDHNIIYDGQHRASCLYYLYGNIEVPVLRIYSTTFTNIKLRDRRIYQDWLLYKWYKNIIIFKNKACVYLGSNAKKVKKLYLIRVERRKKSLERKTHQVDQKLIDLFNAK